MADLPAKPASREEEYLASIAGMAAEVPPCPRSRKEAYLDAIDQRAEGLQSDVDELNDKVTALATDFSYKGSVETAEDLPANPEQGDVYTVEDTGVLYVWDGIQWVALNDSKKVITGSSDPTSFTEGALGQLYLNTTSGELFYCSATGDTYTWVSLGSPIQSISVNGVAQTPDANKNVNLTIGEGIKTLTTADYDYPDKGRKTSVALWRLPRGLYEIPTGVSARISTTQTVETDRMGSIIVLISRANQTNITLFGSGYYGVWSQYFATGPDNGVSIDLRDMNPYIRDNAILTTKQVIDDLITANSKLPLSANQGKVLNERIGDLTTLTTTAKTSTVAAINEIVVTIGNVESALNIINNGSES